MKVAKVEHARTAVGERKEIQKNSVGGFIYNDPAQPKKKNPSEMEVIQNLDTRFSELNNRAQNLKFNVFNEIQPGSAPAKPKKYDAYKADPEFSSVPDMDAIEKQKIRESCESYDVRKQNFDRRLKYKKIAEVLNINLSKLIFTYKDTGRTSKRGDKIYVVSGVQTPEKLRDLASSYKWQDEVPEEEDIRGICEGYVRSSLRTCVQKVEGASKAETIDLRKVIAKMLLAMSGQLSAEELSLQEITAFTETLHEAYYRTNQQTLVTRSIYHQNMVVQPDEQGVVSLSKVEQDKKQKKLESTGRSRKNYEKAGEMKTLSDYAVLSKDERMVILRKLRRILDIYFSHSEKEDPKNAPLAPSIPINDTFDVWADHEEKKQTEGMFVSIPEVISSAAKENRTLDSLVSKNAFDMLNTAIRNHNMACYRYTIRMIKENAALFFPDDAQNTFWVHHIESEVERILTRLTTGDLFKLQTGYLSEKVWKGMINELSIKYIAIGKAVYNFAMTGLTEDGDIDLTKMQDVKGITSYDYEMIKAEETLQRDTAVNISYAANNLARATVNVPEGDEDFLLWKIHEKELEKDHFYNRMKSDDGRGTITAIFQFFGGISSWPEGTVEKIMQAYSAFSGREGVHFLNDLKEAIFLLRNKTFHFNSKRKKDYPWNQELICSLFEQDLKSANDRLKDKFYSNNLPDYYSEEDLRRVMDFLYAKPADRATQVPSFNRVFAGQDYQDFFAAYINQKNHFRGADQADILSKWKSAVFYLCKEIYYNGFLQEGSARKLFFTAISNNRKALEQKNNEKKLSKDERTNLQAVKDFSKRCDTLKDNSLAEICQAIMTEYNLQNSGHRKVQSSDDEKRDAKIFQHFETLLKKMLRDAFCLYLQQNDRYTFLVKQTDALNEKVDQKDFLKGWQSQQYADLMQTVRENPELQAWYVCGRFLNGKTLNLLSGDLRQYIQFESDVKRRAAATKNAPKNLEHFDSLKNDCRQAVRVLDVCIQLSSVFSKEITDYFSSNEEYAQYLSKYIEYIDPSSSLSAFDQLRDFSAGLEDEVKNLYMDEKNPIPNRNLIMSKLYGPDRILAEIVNVTTNDIAAYRARKVEVEENRKKEAAETGQNNVDLLSVAERNTFTEYQYLKNKVELRNVVDYGELINELHGQLVNWSFLRERDLLYFQLGFHYVCLHNDSAKPDIYRCITRKNNSQVNGAILYQLAAMYIQGIPMYSPAANKTDAEPTDTGMKERNGNMSPGGKYRFFCNYSGAMTGAIARDKDGVLQYFDESIYEAGLELFENVKEHENIINLRDAIDHFKYYSGKTGSLLDLYSEVFDRFFTYDMRYKKNVPNLLGNILQRHFVTMRPYFGSAKKQVGKSEEKARASIDIANFGLKSDRFTYKVKDNDGDARKWEEDARNTDYLETIGRILYYPVTLPDDKIAEPGKGKFVDDKGKKCAGRRTKANNKPINAAGKESVERKQRNSENAERKLLTDYKKGQKVTGVVTNITSFGAFVDFGAEKKGLVHISKMSHDFVNDPHDIVKEGEMITVKIIHIDLDNGKISLSMI